MRQATAKGIWGRLRPGEKSGGGVWEQVDSQLTNQPLTSAPPKLSVWDVLHYQPGGLWQDLGDETIVFESSIDGLWREALDESIVRESSPAGLWDDVDDETLILEDRSATELWQEVGEETIVLSRPDRSVWEEAAGRPGFNEMQPNRRLGYALKKLTTVHGEEYFILKNLRQGSYLRLNDRQLFLWNLMDGENTIQDIAVAYMAEFGSLDISVLVDLLGKLEAGNYLTAQRTNVYDQLREKISGRGLLYWLKLIGKSFLQREFPIPGMNNFYTRTYNGGIKYLYSKPVQILLLILAVTGTIAFGYLLYLGRYSIVRGATGSFSLGIIMLYLAHMFALFIHEGGHAYTCKHYGRDIRKSGVMIYYGMFAFYVDSTDIWMETRMPRIMVSFGGPYTGFVLGGTASMIALFSPYDVLNGWAYQFAFLIIFDSIMNLNPLLKWDGYYILMDLLEMPNLRTRSLNFMKSGKLFTKFFRREGFNREERALAIYGILTFVYTGSFFVSFIIFFGDTVVNFIAGLGINPNWLIPLLIIFVLFITRKKIFRLLSSVTRRRAATRTSDKK